MAALMFQGTGSNVGKSTLVAGLARAYARAGLTVRPFKPQNMSNNAAVTADGGEIGRAQALQARAAGVAPSVHMNPVLLKPQSERGAQVIVQGRVVGNARAAEFQAMKAGLLPAVLDSFARLAAEADLVLVEGAGSASEINLRANDIANMGFAQAAQVPVVLIGDIDRGGVIASLVGTRTVLDKADSDLICGFIINKMRGDSKLFDEGMKAIVSYTGWPALGLVPHFDGVRRLPAEDSVELAARYGRGAAGTVRVVVPRLPWIANVDDLDPLAAEDGVDLHLVDPGGPLPPADLILLPGSKATVADLAALRVEGWDIDIRAHHRRGGLILGLCGGYQMLGQVVADPDGVEGAPGAVAGLGLLAVETILAGDKRLAEVAGTSLADGAAFRGYEMHMGRTAGPDCGRPLLGFHDGRRDGAVSADGRVFGTYVHGLFAAGAQRRAWLGRLGARSDGRDHDQTVDETLDALADHLARHIDLGRLLGLAR